MSRQLSTSQPTLRLQTKQLGTAVRRTQRNQVNAMVRLAERLIEKVDQDGLVKLIDEFKKFAGEYATTLDNANQSGQLSFLLRSGIERLLQEWNILSRACEQRRETNPKYMTSEDRRESTRYYLEQADAMLASYCARWKSPDDPVYVPLQKPVVYFEKLYRISRALFAPNIPVISIPLSDYDAPDRWQALAHEMGHHIFWNGVGLNEFAKLQNNMREAAARALLHHLNVNLSVTRYESLDASLHKRIDLWARWLEEVFADICGVLFAGPAFAYSAQKLATASVNTLDDLVGADGQTHPSWYLRPLIALQVLREMAAASAHDDYRQAVLDWAGSGEAETQRRAPTYDDFIKSSQDLEWQGGKRIPADLRIAAGTALPGDRHWQLFTSLAADEKYPGVEVTLSALAEDVPVIVKALLYEPLWPGQRRLWDLVQRYDATLPIKKQIKELEDLSWVDLPYTLDPPTFPPLPDPQTLPDSLKTVAERIQRGLRTAQVQRGQEAKVFWTLLSALDVESDGAGYAPHDWASDHAHEQWWFALTRQHKHDTDGLQVVSPW